MRESGVVAHMPEGLSFEEAAAVADGALTALSGLEKVDLRAGRSILVYGASGSIGTASVQLARHFGAHVTAVCNTQNVELVRSLGADEVIDYQQEDFTKNGGRTTSSSTRSARSRGGAAELAQARRGLPLDTDPGSCGTFRSSRCGHDGSATRT